MTRLLNAIDIVLNTLHYPLGAKRQFCGESQVSAAGSIMHVRSITTPKLSDDAIHHILGSDRVR